MRHGSITMATTGRCKCTPCHDVHIRYVKRWRLARRRGVRFMVDPAPSRRKLQSLQRLGYTQEMLAREMGTTGQSLSNILRRDKIKARTEVRVEEMYRRLEMVIPPDTRQGRQAKNRAARNGWPPPLAYDDIDAGILAVVVGEADYSHDRRDLDVVDHVMATHDFTIKMSPLEKAEVVRRWLRSGRSEAALCRLTGWKEGRYREALLDAS